MSFLTGLGSFAGGLDQTLGPLLQQYQQNVATGQGIAAMYGGQPQQQGGLQGLTGGGAPNVPVTAPQTATAQPSTVPVNTPSSIPNAPSSIPQLSQAPTSPVPSQAQPSPMPASAPRTAQGGQSLGRMPQPASAPPPAQPQPQQQQQKPPPDLSPFNNQFDFNTLMQAVVRHNTGPNGRPNYEQIGKIANSPAFERMLTQQGLNQYRMLNLGNQLNRTGIMEDQLTQEANKFKATSDRLNRNEEIRTQGHALDRQEQQIERQYTQQSGRLIFLPQDQQKAVAEKLDKDYNDKMDAINKKRDELDKQSSQATESGDSSGGGGQDPLEEAKAAIAAGRNKQMVIERFKKLHPDLDASGL